MDITLFISSASNIKNVVSDISSRVIEELRQEYPNVKEDFTLFGMLYNITEATGRKFIVIIDEWDALFREAKEDTELQKEYINFLRGMFKSSWTDKMLEAAYMTGILPIKKYGSQSAVSDFREYTMLNPKNLAEYVGFTENEVKMLCEQSQMNFDEMKHWYDGYSFRRLKSVYSPNSVMEAIKSGDFESYWTRTETYESLKIYIELNEDGLKEAIIQMLGGAHIKINVGSFQNDMTNIRVKDDVLTLLVHLGYLGYDADSETVFIPNEEVRQEFLLAVTMGGHKEIARMIQNSDILLEETLN
ncbi:MAG: AAA family ATPase [Lachnospiraceae bacterium]|nr:AAA family ATPase [Lachnospiraceae bacterium]